MMQKLFQNSRPLTYSDVRDPYTNMAVTYNLDNYRIYSLASLVSGETKFRRGKDIPDYLYDFIGEQGEVLGIANPILGRVFSIKFKSLKEKKFLTVGTKRALPYGIGLLKEFKYGDWLILVEGEKDRDSLAQIYPNVVCTSTAGAGSIMKEILLTLTDKFIIYYDADDSGRRASYRDKKVFESRGCTIEIGQHPSGCHDPGTLSDLIFKNDSFTAEYFSQFYKNAISNITGI